MWSDADLARSPWPDFPPRWASAWGDDRYGLYAVLRMGSIEQLMRWIEPGSFWMGSTLKERQGPTDKDLREWADKHEAPRHFVTLTQGYWLADTPCTQSLWTTVMDKNPSRFADQPDSPQRPVEQVSWDMVQEFLAGLSKHLPANCEPALPTEAQWEHAARAGTDTAYWWGDQADGSTANWAGKQNGTTAVKHYPANPWGLYDVHGNVWEWCAGSMRPYEDREAVDPPDGQDQGVRALRGGAWRDGAGRARSAYRFQYHRDFVWVGSGFRLVLRSAGQEGGGAAAGVEGSGGA